MDREFAPVFAPFNIPVTAPMVQDVWDTYVKPDQEAGNLQSGEMRILMGILREAFRVLEDEKDV